MIDGKKRENMAHKRLKTVYILGARKVQISPFQCEVYLLSADNCQGGDIYQFWGLPLSPQFAYTDIPCPVIAYKR